MAPVSLCSPPHPDTRHCKRNSASLDDAPEGPTPQSHPACSKRQCLTSATHPWDAPSTPTRSADKGPLTEPDSPPGNNAARPVASLRDRFQLKEAVLGSGQFGTVRECEDLVTGETLACKTLRTAGNRASSIRQGGGLGGKEWGREVEMMARLAGHQNIVQLRGVFEEEGEVHLIMDLCRGGEVFDAIVEQGSFEENEAALIFSEVVEAVAFCHRKGVMHRDLKPENILLPRKLEQGVPLSELAAKGPLVKLADFGLAEHLPTGQRLSGMAGSPTYVAPEVLTGEYDAKADVWSLGVILYILLTGSPPFWGEADAELFQSIVHDHPDLTSGPWRRISMEARSLVRCCLHKDPARRPSAEKILTHPWFRLHLAASGAE